MNRSKARPLRTLTFKNRPLAPHALAWSCDAELAVAADSSIYVFLPEYPHAGEYGDASHKETIAHQFSLCLETLGLIRPDPALNAQLCAFAGIRLPVQKTVDESTFRGVGSGFITMAGAPMSQVVRLEWSPNGLGCNLRPVLTAMLTNGSIVSMGEHINPRSTMTSGMRSRGFKSWKLLWGLGALLPIPDEGSEQALRFTDERITSFSWAKEIGPGRSLLAYENDISEIVIMSIQFLTRENSSPTSKEEPGWEIQEMARFDGTGPHAPVDPADLDFVPHGTAFSLKWSPWLEADGLRTATLAYIAKNHVGFRRVTIQSEWEKGDQPNIEVEEADTTSICLFMSTDAFVDWEDEIWIEDEMHIARGVIATPFTIKSFQVSLSGPLDTPRGQHAIWDCSTAYPPDGENSSNPITGLAIHRPDPMNKPIVPEYSLVRLSATSENQDWYQTNMSEEDVVLPQWAELIGQETARLVSREEILAGLDSDSDSGEDEIMADDGSTAQVHPYRFRLWGMATSPGDGSTAVLVSKHNTQHPDRNGSSRLLFGWRAPTEENGPIPRDFSNKLTTEGRLWEWMYGEGGEVKGTASKKPVGAHSQNSPLRLLFQDMIQQQRCVFCDATLQNTGDQAECDNGHPFATCAASGLAILGPGISRICAVCELRCIKVSELAKIAQESIGPEAWVGSSGEVCGGCGGKFIA